MPTIPARVEIFFRVEVDTELMATRNPDVKTTWGGDKTLVNNGKNYQPQLVTAGFLNHQQYDPPFKDLFGAVHGIKRLAFQKVAVDNLTEPLPLVVRQGWQRGQFWGYSIYPLENYDGTQEWRWMEDDFPFQLGDF